MEQEMKERYLKSLHAVKNGDWETAHNLIQDLPTREAALIHAYLHRVEGDIWNADYWYQRAGSTRPTYSLEEEWDFLVEKFEN